VIRRRSSQQKGKEAPRDGDAPEPFFNFTDSTPAAEAPLFNLEEVHEKRIHSWSPEPEEFFDYESPAAEPEPTRAEREELARSVYERPVALEERVELAPQPTIVARPPAPVPVEAMAPIASVEAPPAPRIVSRPVAPLPVPEPVREPVYEPVREVAPPAPQVEAAAEDELVDLDPTASPAPKRRGRPRGRPRRQVHFHVDPDEEGLLMLAVERYGSQQKGLIAALESLQEADFLRDEIEKLRAELARQRRLLDEAESLFKR
jgi:hypothetical protein